MAIVDVKLENMIVEQEVPDDWTDKQVQEYVDGVDWGMFTADIERDRELAEKGEIEAMVARGVGLNNPGNIKIGTDKWEGLSLEQPDSVFHKFESPEMGLRAMAKILQTYKNKHNIDTVASVINRWAPPTENDTNSYSAFVAARMGIGVDDTIDLSSSSTLQELMKAMVFLEQGGNPYEDDQIVTGMRLAGVQVNTGDTLRGGQGDDTLAGGGGDDTILKSSTTPEFKKMLDKAYEVPTDRTVVESALTLIPANVKAFLMYKAEGFFGGSKEEQIYTENDFNDGELSALKRLIMWAEGEGKHKVTYRDYDVFFGKLKNGLYPSEIVAKKEDYKLLRKMLAKRGEGGRPSFTQMMNEVYGENDEIALMKMAMDSVEDPEMSILLTLASVSFSRDKEDNLIIAKDKYDFPNNKSRSTAFNRLRADLRASDKDKDATFAFELNLGK